MKNQKKPAKRLPPKKAPAKRKPVAKATAGREPARTAAPARKAPPKKPPRRKVTPKPEAPRTAKVAEETADFYSCAFCHTYVEKPFAVCGACGQAQPAPKKE